MYSMPNLWVLGLRAKAATMVSTMVCRSICSDGCQLGVTSSSMVMAYVEIIAAGADVCDGFDLGLCYTWRFQCLKLVKEACKLLQSWLIRHCYWLLLVALQQSK
jgi:hypothetical protein